MDATRLRCQEEQRPLSELHSHESDHLSQIRGSSSNMKFLAEEQKGFDAIGYRLVNTLNIFEHQVVSCRPMARF